jgi:hypothetical protein
MLGFVVQFIIIIIIIIIKIDLQEVGWRGMDWVYLAQVRDGL